MRRWVFSDAGAGCLAAIACAIAWLALLAGCGEQGKEEAAAPAPASQGISRTTEIGPVRAVVTLAPEKPVLGDPLTLTLEVTAEPGVEIEMPAFGEALGRFQIVQFVPREQRGADGKAVLAQTYTLQAPMSGRQRIPPLQVELVDRRGHSAQGAQGAQTVGAGQDAGAAVAPAGEPEAQELLTEEIPVQIGSVLPEGEVAAELRPVRASLPLRSHVRVYAAIALAALVLLGVGGFLAVRAWRQAARRQVRISAYDQAMARLRELEQRGLPRPGEDGPKIDQWYVELSAIVRRYLEDRYHLRAPELTTEEFLREAQRSGLLSSTHRALLSDFLVRCDRVKFARYEPDEEESRQALASARTFLDETRLVVASDQAGASSQAVASNQAGASGQPGTAVEKNASGGGAS
jgi:hypothetical protein